MSKDPFKRGTVKSRPRTDATLARVASSAAARAVVRNTRMQGARPRPGAALNRRGVASKETGYVDTASATYAFDTTGSIVLIPTVAQGASVNQRIGKKLSWKSLQCRGYVANGTAATFNDCCMLIVYDKRPQGSLPAITDILVTANSRSMNNDANSGRFQILKRVDWVLNGIPATTNGDGPAMSADFFLDLKGKAGVFKAAGTGAIGDIEEGAIYLVTVGNNVAGTSAAGAELGFRTRFIDN